MAVTAARRVGALRRRRRMGPGTRCSGSRSTSRRCLSPTDLFLFIGGLLMVTAPVRAAMADPGRGGASHERARRRPDAVALLAAMGDQRVEAG